MSCMKGSSGGGDRVGGGGAAAVEEVVFGPLGRPRVRVASKVSIREYASEESETKLKVLSGLGQYSIPTIVEENSDSDDDQWARTHGQKWDNKGSGSEDSDDSVDAHTQMKRSQDARHFAQQRKNHAHRVDLRCRAMLHNHRSPLAVLVINARETLKGPQQVNTHLHSTLVARSALVKGLRADIQKIKDMIALFANVQLPARIDEIRQAEIHIKSEQMLQQLANLELGKSVMDWEDKFSELSAKNAKLKEAGRVNRSRLKEQHVDLALRKNTVRDLRRHIEILEGEDASEQGEAGPVWASEAAHRNRSSSALDFDTLDFLSRMHTGKPMSRMTTQPEDHLETDEDRGRLVLGKPMAQYQKLPGLDLAALLNEAEDVVSLTNQETGAANGGRKRRMSFGFSRPRSKAAGP